MSSLDALTYFLLNLGLHNVVLVVLAMLLGIAFAYFIWGKAKHGVDELQVQAVEADRRAQDAELSLGRLKEEFKTYRKDVESGELKSGPDVALERKARELEGEREKLEKELKSTKTKRDDLEKALTELRKDKVELQNKLAAKVPALPKGKGKGAARMEQRKMREEKEALEKKLRGEIKELEKKLVEREKGTEKAKKEAETLRKEKEALAGKTGRAGEEETAKVKSLKDEKEKLVAQVAALKGAEKGGEDLKLREELEAIRWEKDRLAKDLAGAKKEAAETRDAMAELKREKTDVEGLLKTARDEAGKAHRERDDLKEEREKAAGALEQVSQAEERLAAIKKEKAGLEEKLKAETEGAAKAKAELEKLQKERSELAVKAEEGSKAGDELRALRGSKIMLEEKVGKLEADHKKVEEAAAKSGAEVEALKGEKKALEKDLAEIKAGVASAAESLKTLRNEKQDLMRQLNERKELSTRVAKKVELLQTQMAGLEETQKVHKEESVKWERELARLREEKKELHEQLAMQAPAEEGAAAVLVQGLKSEREALEARLRDEQHERMQVEQASAILRQELYGLRKQLDETDRQESSTAEAEETLRAAEEKLMRFQAELSRAVDLREDREEEIRRLKFELEEAGEARRRAEAALQAVSPPAGPSEEEPPAGKPAPGGKAELRADPDLGELYDEAPSEADDLTEIKGIGAVLAKRLNEAGVYTFRQIARWDEGVMEEFGERLAFRDRIVRDDWRGQARDLHRRKYGEELGAR